MNFLVVLIGIGAVILIHELGHFLAAKYGGVKVEVFSIGFGPRLLGIKIGETDYRLSLIPFGGYVKMAGEEPGTGKGEEDELFSKPVGIRFLIFSAGVIMNFLFALFLFTVAFQGGVPFKAPVIGSVEKGGPAWEAGIPENSRVLAIDGRKPISFTEISSIIALGGDVVNIKIKTEDGKVKEYKVRPVYDPFIGAKRIKVGFATKKEVKIDVSKGSPADKAGLKSGDILIEINDLDINDPKQREKIFEILKEGKEIIVSVIRKGDKDGKPIKVKIKPIKKKGPFKIGITPAIRMVNAVHKWVNIVKKSGLKKGCILINVNNKDIYSEKDFKNALLLNKNFISLKYLDCNGKVVKKVIEVKNINEKLLLWEHVALKPYSTYISVIDNMPAREAGLLPGDKLLVINGRKVRSWNEIVAAIAFSKGSVVSIVLERGEKKLSFKVKPKRIDVPDYGFVPVFSALTEVVKAKNPLNACILGIKNSITMFKEIYLYLKKMIFGKVSAKNLGGPILIISTSASILEQGILKFIWFLAVISINLCFLNLLPIPVLDGGHLLFLVLEKIKGSPVSERIRLWAQIAGLVFILSLALFVTYNDIIRLIS